MFYPKYPRFIYTTPVILLLFMSVILLKGTLIAQSWSSFVIPGSMSTTSPIDFTLQPIDTTSPRLIATGTHFTRNGERVRIWGTNITANRNFPDKSYTSILADRLAKAGINCIRLHWMDGYSYPYGIWNSNNSLTLDPQALDKLDYFIYQLALHGIYCDMNLHVGRAYSTYIGLPNPGTNFNNIVDLYTPAIINAEKDYANQLLTHVNPYRGVRNADDPAVAFVEITNEDSFFMWNSDSTLAALPSYYENIIQNQYDAWLISRYSTTSALSTAWIAGIASPGPNMLLNSSMQSTNPGTGAIEDWFVEIHSPAYAIATTYYRAPYNGIQIQITQSDNTDWNLQFEQVNLAVQANQYYTVTFQGAADTARTMPVGIFMNHAPWNELGLYQTIQLTSNWSTYTYGFYATADDTNARLCFLVGASSTSVYLANPQFYTGGQQGLLAGEYLATTTVHLFGNTEESAPRTRDRLRFLAQTEKGYFDSMRSYVKDTIGCGALVTGTVVFGPLGLYAQSDMDYIDSHAYWQHPQFPGVAWDLNNWFIEQIAMTDNPSSATLFSLACNRLSNKPFTVSEYNHPAPNDYQEECVPMITSFAAVQDWDGVWLYTYGNPTIAPDPQAFNYDSNNNFFDNYVNAAKWGFVPAGAAILRNSSMLALPTGSPLSLVTSSDVLGNLVELRRSYGDNMNASVTGISSINWQQPLSTQFTVTFSTSSSYIPTGNNGTSLSWQTVSGNGFYAAQGVGGWAYTGYTTDFAVNTYGQITVNSPNFAAITITPLDAETFIGAHHLLIAASGRCENTGMIFSSDRTTVGTNWGYPPVLIEPVDANITLPPGTWTCQSLGPDGSPQSIVPVTSQSGIMSVHISPTYGTMWYLLTRTNITTSVPNFWMFFY